MVINNQHSIYQQKLSKVVLTLYNYINRHWVSWVFIGRTDVEAEAPILWPLDAKS